MLLNILDGVYTYIGIHLGIITEANKIMVSVIANPFKILIIKILIPTIVLILISKGIKEGFIKLHKASKIIVNMVLYTYAAVLCIHAVWVCRYFLRI